MLDSFKCQGKVINHIGVIGGESTYSFSLLFVHEKAQHPVRLVHCKSGDTGDGVLSPCCLDCAGKGLVKARAKGVSSHAALRPVQ